MVLTYQKDKSNADEILNCFNNFLWMFVNIICNKNSQVRANLLKIKSIRKFVSLFMYDKDNRKNINQVNKRVKVANNLCATASSVHDIFALYTEEDIRNELINALLLMATKYKDERPSFHNYVDKCFSYYAYAELKKLFKDPIARVSNVEYLDDMYNALYFNDIASVHNIEMEDVHTKLDIEHELEECNMLTLDERPSHYSDSFFNINWINGITCDNVFMGLGSMYREILIMYYVQGMTDEQIAKALGICRVNVNKKRNEAKRLLEKKLKR